jgi:2-amino-4-hydroxy-6-hydroxymethyldihydropteridine diphosphokinase
VEHSKPRPNTRNQSITAYLGLGSNLGDRAANLWEATRRLGELRRCTVERVSRLYETAPVGPQDQPWFLNAALRVETAFAPHDLLHAAQQIEQAMGRTLGERWGPRIIDLDVLLFGEKRIASAELTIPHPELWKRRFVLVPLMDVVPSGPLAEEVRRRLEELGEEQELRPWPA